MIQPCLLQYHSGTLNLNIDQILVSQIAKHFGDSEINWDFLLAIKELAGHTIFSLKKTLETLRNNARKHGLERKDVGITELLREANTTKRRTSKAQNERSKHIIQYFEKKCQEMSITDIF